MRDWLGPNWGNRVGPAGTCRPIKSISTSPAGPVSSARAAVPAAMRTVLEKDSWRPRSSMSYHAGDAGGRQHRIRRFPATLADSVLRNLGTRTILFAGVNTDQCVFCTLTDANFLGYGCVMIEDCCATTSPDFCTQASVWNVKKCYGFVTHRRWSSRRSPRLAHKPRRTGTWSNDMQPAASTLPRRCRDDRRG